MAKVRVKNYSFNAAAKTITFSDYSSIELEGILIVSNSTDQIIIFNFADQNKGGTVATNVLTLEYDTTTMSNSDDLLIYYDDPASTVTLADDIVNAIAELQGAQLLVFDGTTWDRARGTSTDGLLVNLGTNNDVTITGTVPLPTGAATSANQSTEITALQLIDDIVHSGDAALSKYAVIGAVFDDTGTATVTENQAQSLRMSSRRALLVEGVASGTNVNVNVNAALPTGTNNIGDVDVLTIAAGDNLIGRFKISDGTDVADVLDLTNSNPLTVAIVDGSGTQITSFGGGTQYTEGDTDASITGTAMMMEGAANALVAAQGTAADGLLVNLGTNNDVIQATASNLNAQVVGAVAHDAADSGNPIKIGLKAIAHGTNPTAVAAADRTDWYANRAGVPFVIGGHPNIVTLRTNYTSAQTDAALITVSAGTKIVVTRASALCDNANTVDVQVRIGFAAATTPTTTGVILSHPGIAAGSGIVEGAGNGILGVGADGEDLRITSEAPTTGSLDIVISYYTIES